jgi:lysozyme
MKISANGLKLITTFEGLSLKPYLDSGGRATIGFGTILYPNGHAVTMDDPDCTQEQANGYLEWQVNQKAARVSTLVKVPVNQNQFDALCSFAYNLGLGSLGGSTLLKLLNAGDFHGVAAQFPIWDKAGGQVVAGLLRRRLAEQALFLQPV